jgi:hypothetical protein
MSSRGWRRSGWRIDKPRMKEEAGVHNIKKRELEIWSGAEGKLAL